MTTSFCSPTLPGGKQGFFYNKTCNLHLLMLKPIYIPQFNSTAEAL